MILLGYVTLITLFTVFCHTLAFRALLPPMNSRLETLLTIIVVFLGYMPVHYLEISGIGLNYIDFTYGAVFSLMSVWILQYTNRSFFTALFVTTMAHWFTASLEVITGVILSPIMPATMYFEHLERMFFPLTLMFLLSVALIYALWRPLSQFAAFIKKFHPIVSHYAGCVSVILIGFSLFIKYHQYNLGYFYSNQPIHMVLYILLSLLLVYGFYDGYKQSLRLQQSELNDSNLDCAKEQFRTYFANMHDFNNLLQSIDASAPAASDSLFENLMQAKLQQANNQGMTVIYDSNALNLWLSQPFTTQEWINLTLIFGIFFDNATEHLAADTELDRQIHIKFMTAEYYFTISNPVSDFNPDKLKTAFEPGVTSKAGKLLSGFGLYNALKMAEEINLQIKWRWRPHAQALDLSIKK